MGRQRAAVPAIPRTPNAARSTFVYAGRQNCHPPFLAFILLVRRPECASGPEQRWERASPRRENPRSAVRCKSVRSVTEMSWLTPWYRALRNRWEADTRATDRGTSVHPPLSLRYSRGIDLHRLHRESEGRYGSEAALDDRDIRLGGVDAQCSAGRGGLLGAEGEHHHDHEGLVLDRCYRERDPVAGRNRPPPPAAPPGVDQGDVGGGAGRTRACRVSRVAAEAGGVGGGAEVGVHAL